MNSMNKTSCKKPSKHSITPKNDMGGRSKVSLLGQYTSSAIIAKNKFLRNNLNRTNHILYPEKGGSGSMYPLNISTMNNSIHDYKGQTMNVSFINRIDKSIAKKSELNLTLKLETMKHSSTTKCLNDSIGTKMKNCLKNRNSNQGSQKSIFEGKRRSQVSVLSPHLSPDKISSLTHFKERKQTEITKLQKKLKKASKEAKAIRN